MGHGGVVGGAWWCSWWGMVVLLVGHGGVVLTSFNKICHPSQRPRWQVDKEAIGLSRVQQCSSTYNPPS